MRTKSFLIGASVIATTVLVAPVFAQTYDPNSDPNTAFMESLRQQAAPLSQEIQEFNREYGNHPSGDPNQDWLAAQNKGAGLYGGLTLEQSD